MTEHLTIARATPADSLDIWRWRNDAHSRSMSVNTDAVDLPTHLTWFDQSLENFNRYLFVGTWRGEKVGVCRVDLQPDQHIARVSINLNPRMRGRGLSQPLLAAAIAAFRLTSQADLTASIKPQNTASIKCFTGCGFVFEHEDTDLRHYRLTAHQRNE